MNERKCKKCSKLIIIDHGCSLNSEMQEKMKNKELTYHACGIACIPDQKLKCVNCNTEFKIHDRK